jgi:HD superfamily phosphohydrolase
VKRIQDAVHGYIKLSDEEVKVLDSPEVQRLRRIRQLGFSSYVYPSATHTRFEHSLGVMHVAGKFADSLGLSEQPKREYRLAGLLHDVGHGPFSHASEMLAERKGQSHEQLSCEVVDSLEDRIEADVDEIKALIRGEADLNVIAGDIDADRLDYLVRDSYSSGVEYGRIDHDTIVSSAKIKDKDLVFDAKAVPALESLFTSRLQMIKTLYNHHTAIIVEKMIQSCLEYLLDEKSTSQIMKMDDYSAHAALMESETEAKDLFQRILDRRLYKTAVEWGEAEIGREGLKLLEKRVDDTEKLEKKIAEEAGIQDHKVIVDKPETPEIQDINVEIDSGGEKTRLDKISSIPGFIEDAEWRTVSLKIYSPKEDIDKVNKAAKQVLDSYRKTIEDYT